MGENRVDLFSFNNKHFPIKQLKTTPWLTKEQIYTEVRMPYVIQSFQEVRQHVGIWAPNKRPR